MFSGVARGVRTPDSSRLRNFHRLGLPGTGKISGRAARAARPRAKTDCAFADRQFGGRCQRVLQLAGSPGAEQIPAPGVVPGIPEGERGCRSVDVRQRLDDLFARKKSRRCRTIAGKFQSEVWGQLLDRTPAAVIARIMNTDLTEENMAKIKAALFAGNKIGAIKLFRDATGKGLAEAK